MLHEVRAIIKTEFHVYIDDEKDEKDNAQIVKEGKAAILNGDGELVDDWEIEEQDIEAIWLDHSICD